MTSSPKIAVIQFPGSNCERETIMAVARVGMQAVPFLWNADLNRLAACDGYVIVGGFSYEDRSRAGVIAALDPVLKAIKIEAAKGKPVLGICNGAQVLVESGLVPGCDNHELAMALTCNKRVKNGEVLGTGFYNDWVQLRLSEGARKTIFTRRLTENTILKMPAAHAEGRFIMPESVLLEIEKQGLAILKYCDDAGKIDPEFPVNPNGSVNNIAAVCNQAGNVMAIMPHPERTQSCDALFCAMRDAIIENALPQPVPFVCHLPKAEVTQCLPSGEHFFVKLRITDNHAASVETALRQLGFAVRVERFVHWQVLANTDVKQAVIDSGELFNTNKESFSTTLVPVDQSVTLLVREKEDVLGQQKTQALKQHFHLDALERVCHGIVWRLHFEEENCFEAIQNTHILFNPYAHEMALL